MSIERFRPSMSGDILKSWAADAQLEIDRLTRELAATSPQKPEPVELPTSSTPCRCGPDGCSDSQCPKRQEDELNMIASSLIQVAEATPGVEVLVSNGSSIPAYKILAQAQKIAVQRGLAGRYVSFYTASGASVLVTAEV